MFEVDAKTVDLNAFMNGMSAKQWERSHFIRIRVLATNSPRKIQMQRCNDGRMIATPPQLNGLWLKQQSFREYMEQYKWNYVLKEEEDNIKDDKARTTKMRMTRRSTTKAMLMANTTPAQQQQAIKSANAMPSRHQVMKRHIHIYCNHLGEKMVGVLWRHIHIYRKHLG